MLACKVETMAKKKTPPTPLGRPKSEKGPRRQILSLKGYDEFKDWLGEFAESERIGVAALLDWALEELAVKRGFRKPPKR